MGYDFVNKIEIERLLYLSDDRQIATYLNIPVSRVKRVRAMAPERLKKPRRQLSMPPQFSDMAGANMDRLRREQGKQCDQLLRRQLETGQCHYDRLTARRMMMVKGWIT